MGDTMRRSVGLLMTALISIAVVGWNGSVTRGAVSATADEPKDGFAGLPEARPSEFEVYVQKLGFGEVPGSETLEEKFTCADPTKCGNQPSVTLRVAPSNYAPDVSWDDALGTGKGHVVAKIAVVDPVPFDRFNLIKDDVVYLWVGTVRGGGKGAALYRARSGKVSQVFQFLALRYCKYQLPQKPSVHHWQQAKCADPSPKPFMSPSPATSGEAIVALTSRSLPASRILAGNEGLWISCSIGCCEVQYTGLT
jgi:hypothetical protein